MMTRTQVEAAARACGPWTNKDTQRASELRTLSRDGLTTEQRDELRILRQREITEAIRLRRTPTVPGATNKETS